MLFLSGIVSPPPNPQAGGCQQLLIQHNRSCPPYMEAISIRNPRTRRSVVTGTHLKSNPLEVHCNRCFVLSDAR